MMNSEPSGFQAAAIFSALQKEAMEGGPQDSLSRSAFVIRGVCGRPQPKPCPEQALVGVLAIGSGVLMKVGRYTHRASHGRRSGGRFYED